MRILISDLDDTLFDTTSQLDSSYSNLRNITPFPGARELLTLPDCRNFLVSKGDTNIQNIKLGVLGIGHLFDGIYVCPTDGEKQFLFEEILATHGRGVARRDIFVLGNRVDSEIRCGNRLGLRTILIAHGKYAGLPRSTENDHPEHTVATLEEARRILEAG